MRIALYDISGISHITFSSMCKMLVYTFLGYHALSLEVLGMSWSYYDSYQLSNYAVGMDYFLTAADGDTSLVYAGFQTQLHFQHQHIGLGIGYREALSSTQYVGSYLFLDCTRDSQDHISFSNVNIGIESGNHALNLYLPNCMHTPKKRISFDAIDFEVQGNSLYKSQTYFTDEAIDYGVDWRFAYTVSSYYTLGGGLYYFRKELPNASILGGMVGLAYAIKPSVQVKVQSIYDAIGGCSFTLGVTFSPRHNHPKTSPVLNKRTLPLNRSAAFIGVKRKKSEWANCYFCMPGVSQDNSQTTTHPKEFGTYKYPTTFSQQLVDQAPAGSRFLLYRNPSNPLAFYKVGKIDLKPGQWIIGMDDPATQVGKIDLKPGQWVIGMDDPAQVKKIDLKPGQWIIGMDDPSAQAGKIDLKPGQWIIDIEDPSQVKKIDLKPGQWIVGVNDPAQVKKIDLKLGQWIVGMDNPEQVKKIDLKPGQWIFGMGEPSQSGKIDLKPGQWIIGRPGNLDQRKPVLCFEQINLCSNNRVSNLYLEPIIKKEITAAITLHNVSNVEMDHIGFFINENFLANQKFRCISLHQANLDLGRVYFRVCNTNFFSQAELYGITGAYQDLVKMTKVNINLESYSEKDRLIPVQGMHFELYHHHNDSNGDSDSDSDSDNDNDNKNRCAIVQPDCSLYEALQPLTVVKHDSFQLDSGGGVKIKRVDQFKRLDVIGKKMLILNEIFNMQINKTEEWNLFQRELERNLKRVEKLKELQLSKIRLLTLIEIFEAQSNKTEAMNIFQRELQNHFKQNTEFFRLKQLRLENRHLESLLSQSPFEIHIRNNDGTRIYKLYELIAKFEKRNQSSPNIDRGLPLDEHTLAHINRLEKKLNKLMQNEQNNGGISVLEALEKKLASP